MCIMYDFIDSVDLSGELPHSSLNSALFLIVSFDWNIHSKLCMSFHLFCIVRQLITKNNSVLVSQHLAHVVSYENKVTDCRFINFSIQNSQLFCFEPFFCVCEWMRMEMRQSGFPYMETSLTNAFLNFYIHLLIRLLLFSPVLNYSQYNCVDSSYFSQYVMHPFWNYLVQVCNVLLLLLWS